MRLCPTPVKFSLGSTDRNGLSQLGGASLVSFVAATRSWWNQGAVWTGSGVAEESANLVGGSGRENVFELAGLLLDFRFAIHCKTVGEEALGETMAADNAARAVAAAGSQRNDLRAVAARDAIGAKRFVAGIHERLVIVGLGRVRFGGHERHVEHFFNGD